MLWKCLRFYCNMTTLDLTPATKSMRSTATLAGQQFHIPHTIQTWHRLTSSDFHLFGPLKESLRGQYFSSNEEVKPAVGKWLNTQSAEFYNEGRCELLKMKKVVRKARDYIEK